MAVGFCFFFFFTIKVMDKKKAYAIEKYSATSMDAKKKKKHCGERDQNAKGKLYL